MRVTESDAIYDCDSSRLPFLAIGFVERLATLGHLDEFSARLKLGSVFRGQRFRALPANGWITA